MTRLVIPEYKSLVSTQIKADKQRAEAMYARADQKVHNISAFYAALYGKLKTDGDSKGRRLNIRDPSELGIDQPGFHPDSLKLYHHGVVAGEIKASSFRNAKFWCNAAQAKTYAQYLLSRQEEGDVLPGVNYGLFLYGAWDDYELYSCERQGKRKDGKVHSCDNDCMSTRASELTRSLSVLPFNLVLGLFSSEDYHKKATLNRTTSHTTRDFERTFFLPARISTALHNVNGHTLDAVADLTGKTKQSLEQMLDPQLYDMLGIGDLKLVRETSPSDLACVVAKKQIPIKPFPIVRFEMHPRDERRWLNNFRNNYGEILEKCLYVQDADAESYDDVFFPGSVVPF